MSEMNKLDDATNAIFNMVLGLHALVFGVASLKDPAHALHALEDGGEIHEYVHAMVRLLPPRRPPQGHALGDDGEG